MKLEFIHSFFHHTTRGDLLKHLQLYGECNSTPFQNGASWGDRLKGSLTKSPSITLCSPEPSSFARTRGVDSLWVPRFCTLLWQLTHTFTIWFTDFDGKTIQYSFDKRKYKSESNRWCGTRKNCNRNLMLESIWFFHSITSYIGAKRHVWAPSGWTRRRSQACCVDNWYINGGVYPQWLQAFIENFVQLHLERSYCFRKNTNPVSTFRL
jgi:hypothetical protein